MLLFSLGLHGMILFVPTAPDEDELLPPPDPEEEGITVTKTAPPTSQRSTNNPETTSTTDARPRANQSARTATPSGNSVQASGAARSRETSGNLRANNRRATTSNARRRETRPAANQRRNSPQNASARSDRTNSSPVVPPLNNPNPPPPAPNAGAVAGRRQFLSYADVFATYQGLNPLTAEETAERQSIWLSSFTEQGNPYSNLKIQPLTEIEPIPYEAKICLPNAPEMAELLVLVEADGTVNSDIMTLRSSGYRQFNQAARAMAEQHTYPSQDLPQAYLVQIMVDYDPAGCQWPPAGTDLPDDYFAVLESYVGPTSTTLSEARHNQAEWLNSLARDEAIASAEVAAENVLEDLADRVTYPDNICLPIEPEEARWGVMVNTDGHLQGEPQLLRSTGYAVFDDRAKALVEDFEFPTAATPQAYVVVVQTAYNGVNCQPLTSQAFDLSDSNSVFYASFLR
ncbi:hypothetical protein DYY88_07200 [Leptolyngbya iicbica LK]|uniref:TonB C-terminal domain-containing protein n=2 Tax=Cyanophyceae TaxID=3028117 RepID=A0A4Q7E8B7_9CYAN|nr:hypothetical protein [Leptolyngbya sp. LK]RZM78589.1 hypothetical protein DYY88_07200 [Leptolyngbya sp. LK]